MIRRTLALLALTAVVAGWAAAPAYALDFSQVFGNSDKSADNFKILHVQDLERAMNDKSTHTYIFDANPPDVRQSEGIIPGAALLSSSGSYDVRNTLPADKSARIVFYCHNLH